MRVVYFSRPCFLDHAFSEARALSNFCELHFLIEGSHNKTWHNIIESGYVPEQGRLEDARKVLTDLVPRHVWTKYFTKLSSFTFIGYTKHIVFDPRTWLENWRLSGEVVKFLKFVSPNIVHFDDLSLRTVFIILKLKRTIPQLPIVLTVHDPIYHYGEYSWKLEIARRIVFNYVDKFILRSHFYYSKFIWRYKIPVNKVSIIPLGYLDILRDWNNTSVSDELENTVLYWGRISPYKGLETLFKAIPIVAEAIPNVKFIVAGKPADGYKMPNVSKLKDAGLITVIPRYISNDELVNLINQSTVIVSPYYHATQSGVVLTAYAFNKPVVATNVGGLPEVVAHEKTGLLVPSKNHQALADGLIRILQDKKLRLSIKAEIEAICNKDLSWDSIVLEILKIYERL